MLAPHTKFNNSPTQIESRAYHSREARLAGLLAQQATIEYGELSHDTDRLRNWDPRLNWSPQRMCQMFTDVRFLPI